MSGGRQIRSRKLGFQPDSARGHLACEATGKMPVVRDSQDGYLPKKEKK
jgi:hypothetical protein